MLKISDLKGNHLADLYQEAGGGLRLEVIAEEQRPELEGLLEAIRTGPVSLVGGSTETRGERIVHETRRRTVTPGEPDFLKAVQDWLVRQKVQVGGQRVRGLLIEPREAPHE